MFCHSINGQTAACNASSLIEVLGDDDRESISPILLSKISASRFYVSLSLLFFQRLCYY